METIAGASSQDAGPRLGGERGRWPSPWASGAEVPLVAVSPFGGCALQAFAVTSVRGGQG